MCHGNVLFYHSEWQKKRENEKLERERLAREAAAKGMKPMISDGANVLSFFIVQCLPFINQN